MAWPEAIKDKNGKIRGYRGRYRDADGKAQDYKENGKTKVFGRKSDAKAAANEAEGKARRKASLDTCPQLANVTWGDWWDQLVEDRTFPTSDRAEKEASLVKLYVRPKWGNDPLNKITHKLVEAWVEDLKAGRMENWPKTSPPQARYVRQIFSVLSVSLNLAITKEILDASPCAAIKNLPKILKRPKPYIGAKAVEMMSTKGKLREDYQDAIKFLRQTGLRPGELCGLHASQIDFDRQWMLVSNVLVQRRRIIRPHPKDGDVRWVPLTPLALEIIERRLGDRPQTGGCTIPHVDQVECDGALVFRTKLSKPMRPTTLTQALKNAAQRAGLPRSGYSGYGGRRGFATAAADGGLDAFALKEILGHETLTMAQEYVQQTPWARERLLVALGAAPEEFDAAGAPQLKVLPGGAVGATVGAHLPQAMQDHAGLDTSRSGS